MDIFAIIEVFACLNYCFYCAILCFSQHPFLEDQSALVRKKIIEIMLSDGTQIEEERIKSILVQPDKNSLRIGLLGGLGSEEGQRYFDEYLFKKYSSLPEEELRILIDKNIIINDIPYFALCSQYFKNNSENLRKNIEDQFKQRFLLFMKYLKKIGVDAKTIESWEKLEDSQRKKLTRNGLDVLCKVGALSDILVIRNNLRSDYIKSSKVEIIYMSKFGEWSDIPFIVMAKKEYTARTILSEPLQGEKWDLLIARTIYKIGRDRLEELLNIEMPSSVLIEIIKMCPKAKFTVLSDQILLSFLNHKEEAVRRIFSLKTLACINKSRIISLLNENIDDDRYRYYSTIFWLDFGASVQNSKTTKAALYALNG